MIIFDQNTYLVTKYYDPINQIFDDLFFDYKSNRSHDIMCH
jgi:hypothetical protein